MDTNDHRRSPLLERTGSEITPYPVGRCVICDADADAHQGRTAIRLPCGAQMHPQCFDWFYSGFGSLREATDCPGCDNNHVIVVE